MQDGENDGRTLIFLSWHKECGCCCCPWAGRLSGASLKVPFSSIPVTDQPLLTRCFPLSLNDWWYRCFCSLRVYEAAADTTTQNFSTVQPVTVAGAGGNKPHIFTLCMETNFLCAFSNPKGGLGGPVVTPLTKPSIQREVCSQIVKYKIYLHFNVHSVFFWLFQLSYFQVLTTTMTRNVIIILIISTMTAQNNNTWKLRFVDNKQISWAVGNIRELL